MKSQDVALCPQCLGVLKYRESSFIQYQPSVYFCAKCDKELECNYVLGFNEGYRKSSSQLVPLKLEEVHWELQRLDQKMERPGNYYRARHICEQFGTQPPLLTQKWLSVEDVKPILDTIGLPDEIHKPSYCAGWWGGIDAYKSAMDGKEGK